MALMRSHRLSSADLRAWCDASAGDVAHGATLGRRVDRALEEIQQFTQAGPCYAGVSWGKDSVVVAHMTLEFQIPLVWVRVEPIANPECVAVRDEFLAMHPGLDYHEVRVDLDRRTDGGLIVSGSLERGFEEAHKILGTSRYISGIRNKESRNRERRYAAFGHSSQGTCAPISLWSGADVFGYLAIWDLPISAVYAMSMGGALDRDRLRVSSLSMKRGSGAGKDEWESVYFAPELEALMDAKKCRRV